MAMNTPALTGWLEDQSHSAVGFGAQRVASPEPIESIPPPPSKNTTGSSARNKQTLAGHGNRKTFIKSSPPEPQSYPRSSSAASNSTGSRQSTASDASNRKYSSSSSTSQHTVVSTVPSEARYRLMCEFPFIGCSANFDAEESENWHSHQRSHFGSAGPPSTTICPFCDQIFDARGTADREANWRARMTHVRRHYAFGSEYENIRPDYFLIEEMRRQNRVSDEDHDEAKKLTERAKCDGLVTASFKTPEMLKRDRINNTSVEFYDRRKEERERQRRRNRT